MYESRIQSTMTDDLFEAILKLSSLEDCYRFFEDICTINEIHAMAQRLEVAKMLDEGITFSTIAARTGASTATISRVNRCLHYGAEGYRRMLDRIAHAPAETQETQEGSEQ